MKMPDLSYRAAMVGACESNLIGYPGGEERTIRCTSLQLHLEAIKNVTEYTGNTDIRYRWCVFCRMVI